MTGLLQLSCTVALVALVIGQRGVSGACTEDFSPCDCMNSVDVWSVTCDGVRMSEIQEVFQRSTHTEFNSLDIKFSSLDSGATLPSDLLAGKVFNGALRLSCPGPDHLLKISPLSFGSANKFTYVSLTGCNLKQQPDFGFMSNLTELRQLWMAQVNGFNSFRGVPSQSNLYQISITYCTDFESLDTARVALPGLGELLLYNNDLSDFSAERAVNALGSLTGGSLFELRLYNNRLTVVPPSVHSITSLGSLMMENNQIRVLGSGTLSFPASSSVGYLNLAGNSIERIEPGAFTAGVTGIYLGGNRLTKFESDTFKPLLENFELLGYGTISLTNNPFVCDCHLEWLIKDNRQFLKYLDGATCSNSTSFNDLNANGYDNCDNESFNCPPTDGEYAAPTPCSNYFYTCSNGVAHLVDCPGGLVFNEAIQVCDWPNNVPGC